MAFNFNPGSYTARPLDFSALANVPEDFWKGQAVGRDNALRNEIAKLPKDANGQPDFQAAMGVLLKYEPQKALALETSRENSASVYGTPIWGTDNATGKEGLGAIGKDGQFHLLNTGNFQPSRGLTIENFGDVVQGLSKNTGAPVGPAIVKGGAPEQGYSPTGPRVTEPLSAQNPQEPVRYSGQAGTPQEVTQPAAGRERMGGAIGVLGNAIKELYAGKGISSITNKTGENIRAYAEQTGVGQEIGRAVGSKNQSLRDTINSTIPMVLADLKVSAGLSAQQFNSNAELQFYQQAAQGGTDLVSRLAAIDALDQAYGTGSSLKQILPATLYKAVRDRSGAMSVQHPPPPPETIRAKTPETQPPQNTGAGTPEEQQAIRWAREAISAGKDPDAVTAKLKEMGYDLGQ